MKDTQIVVWSVVLAVHVNISASWEPAGRMHQEMPQVSGTLVVFPGLLEAAAPLDHSSTSIGAVEVHPPAVQPLDQAHRLGRSTAGCFITIWHLPMKCRRQQQ